MDKWKYKVRYDSNDEIWLKIGVTAIDEWRRVTWDGLVIVLRRAIIALVRKSELIQVEGMKKR